MSDENKNLENDDQDVVLEGDNDAELSSSKGNNSYLRNMMDMNYLEYASYVLKDRAIPDVDDGLKPVQRRILWSLFRMDDGKFHKVANVIGHTMQFHPHGDASIGGALIVLANKEYFIEKQGNFGNILTGDAASAARYIECRLSPLAKEVMFNNAITKFVDSYDGRNKEPISLPAKVPSLLMGGAEGIGVGMSTRILSHNFIELLEAQIAILRKESYVIYPDFLQGGTMDASEYEDGNGKVAVRAKIDKEGRRLIIRELAATTTTESLIASIEKAVANGKIKISEINDFTGEQVEIEIVPMRGYDVDKCLNALYAYTDCSVSISVNMLVICDNKPVTMSVSSVLERNTNHLLEYFRQELNIELGHLEDAFHWKTLAQIFIENRIYKRIEECTDNETIFKEVYKGLEPFRHMLKRDVIDADIERLLALPIRRISLFDINKNKKDLEDIIAQIDQVQKHLKRLKSYTIKYLQGLIEKYKDSYPRRTEVVSSFNKIDRRQVALNNIKVGWDRKNSYIGTQVKSDDSVMCNEYDHLLCVERKGNYKVIGIPDKVFCGRLYDFRKYDKDTVFAVIYSDKKTGKWYIKRTVIDKFIKDKTYRICPEGCRLELFTSRINSIYKCKVDIRLKEKQFIEVNLSEAPLRSPKARGLLISPKKILKIKFDSLFEMNEAPSEQEEEEKVEENRSQVIIAAAPVSEPKQPEKKVKSVKTSPKNGKKKEKKEASDSSSTVEQDVVVAQKKAASVKEREPVENVSKSKHKGVKKEPDTSVKDSAVKEEKPVSKSDAKEETVETVEKVVQNGDKNLKNSLNDGKVSQGSDVADELFESLLPGLELTDIDEEIEELKKEKKKKSGTKKRKKIIDDDEDLGIVQPEFDF